MKTVKFIVVIAFLAMASGVMAEVVFQDDFEAYDIENPSDFSIEQTPTGNWTPSNTDAGATRIYVTANFGGSRLWISITDGTSITSRAIDAESDRYYKLTFLAACETFRATRINDVSYDVLLGTDASSATSLTGGPVVAQAHGDAWLVDDSQEDHYLTGDFHTGTVNAGEKLFIVLTRVGTNAESDGSSWQCFDDVTLEAGPSTNAPLLSAPSDDAQLVPVDLTAAPLTWIEPLTGPADSYNVIYKADPNLTSNPTVVTGIAGLTYVPATLDFDTTYYWIVESVLGANTYQSYVWSFTTAPEVPLITTDPVNVTVEADNPATLFIEQLNGTTFQWYKNGAAVPGATSVTYNVSAVQQSDEGVYYCVASNTVGSDTSENAVIMTKRLVAHWDFEDTSLVGDVDGWVGVFTDPNEFAPAPDPAPRFTAGYAGTGFDFTGDSRFIEVQGTEGLFNFFPQGFSVGCWIKADGGTGAYSAMAAKHTYSDPRAGFLVTQQNSNGIPRLTIDGWGGMSGVGSVSVQDENWHYVVMTYEAEYDPEQPGRKQGRVYTDGGGVTYDVETGATTWLRTTASGTGTPSLRWDVPLRLGADNETGAGSLDGTVDEIKVWSYALTPTEVAAQYTTYETSASICTDEVALDLTGPDGVPDCQVNLLDFAVFANQWLNCNKVPECL